MDARAAAAREAHEAALAAAGHRERRDQLLRQLRREDAHYWTYKRLARIIDCSPELIAKIVRNPE